jgi:hypothetical protein
VDTVLKHLVHYFHVRRSSLLQFLTWKRHRILLLFAFCVLYLLAGKMTFIPLLLDFNRFTPKVNSLSLSPRLHDHHRICDSILCLIP